MGTFSLLWNVVIRRISYRRKYEIGLQVPTNTLPLQIVRIKFTVVKDGNHLYETNVSICQL